MARMHRFEDTVVSRYCDIDMTFEGHRRSKVMMGKERSHMASYMLLIVIIWFGCTVLKIQQSEDSVTLS